jgi:cytochrome c peroxidase
MRPIPRWVLALLAAFSLFAVYTPAQQQGAHRAHKVPSLRGLWYRDTLEHSGSMQSLEEWFDSARLAADYRPKGCNPPDVKTRPVPGHLFGLNLPAEDKRALLAFLRTL